MKFETLEYTDAGGVVHEVALNRQNLAAAGGAVKLQFTPRSHAPSEFSIEWKQRPEDGIDIPFRSRCKVRANRDSVTGAPDSFTGGTIIFQGRRTDNDGHADAKNVSVHIVLSDAWWDLTKVTYVMPWQYPNGGTIDAPVFATFNWPDLVLFQAAPAVTYNPPALNSSITTWQQLQAILQFAAGYAGGNNAVQIQLANSGTFAGNIWTGGLAPEFTPAYVNWYPIRSAKCAEAINVCLRPHPGVFTEIDYSTTPPTLHFRNRANLTNLNLPYKQTDAAGIIHLTSDIKPLPELVPDNVRLFYKINGTVNGQPATSYDSDVWPNGDNHLLSVDYSIDITGSAQTQTQVAFVSTPIDPTSLALWQKKSPALKAEADGGQLVNGSIAIAGGVTVKDDAGNDIDLGTFKYYTDADLFTWMKLAGGAAVQAKYATLSAVFGYQKKGSSGGTTVIDKVINHQNQMRIMLTNAPSGTYVLKQTTQAGELIPANLAKKIYDELADLQWKLRHEVIQVAPDANTVPTLIKPGKHKINLIGGDDEWRTMNAVAQEVTINFYRTADGRLVVHHNISCGPVDHLNPDYLIQLANLFWNRNRSGIDAYQRLTGASSSNQTDLSANGSRENSTATVPLRSVQNHLSPDGKTRVVHDAENGFVTLQTAFTPR